MEHFAEIAVLAVVQGVTEFLPVSSSGHLVVCKNILGLSTPGAGLEIALHLGTLVSILAYYGRTVCSILAGLFRMEKGAWSFALAMAVSAVPAVALYFSLKYFCGVDLEEFFSGGGMVAATGVFLVLTGLLLVLTRFVKSGSRDCGAPEAFAMGCAQAAALLPGVSRSGATLFAARLCKVEPGKAAAFSFLMSAPLIAGAAVMKMSGAGEPAGAGGAVSCGGAEMAAGAAIAAVTGYFALAFLVKSLKSGGFWLFGLYCIAAGCAIALFA